MLDPIYSLNNYDQNQAILQHRDDLDELDFIAHNDDTIRSKIEIFNKINPIVLTKHEVQYLIDFLYALTEPISIDLRHDMPKKVPSRLAIYV